MVAQTGDTLAGVSLSTFGRGASVNDGGAVAFVGRDAVAGRGTLFLLKDGSVLRSFDIGSPFRAADFVQVNELDQISWRESSDDGLVTFVKRLDTATAGPAIATGSFAPAFPGDFDFLLEATTLNNTGQVVLSADDGASTGLATPNGAGGFHLSSGLSGFPNLYPLVADNATTVARFGGSTNSPLFLFTSPNFFGTAFSIAASPNYLAVGEKPGISDDGALLAFMGHESSLGVGIFAAQGETLFGGPFAPFKVAGDSGFSSFSLSPRVGVNHRVDGSPDSYSVVYLATSDVGSPGPLGIYASRVDGPPIAAPSIGPPVRIVQVGDLIPGLGTVTDLDLYDPVNNSGQVAFWANTTGGQAIVLATPRSIDVVDPACSDQGVCFGALYSQVGPSFVIDESDLDALANASIERDGAITDGVTRLLLRVESGEAVDFALEDSPGSPAGPEWGTLSQLDGTNGGSALTALPRPANGSSFAFAVYTTPEDFPGPELNIQDGSNVRIVATTPSGSVDYAEFVRLLPPPVVLVHGLWSGKKAWKDFETYLEVRGFRVCEGCRVDYGRRFPAASFDPTLQGDDDRFAVDMLAFGISDALEAVRAEGIAGTQVDVVGHSMGGLVARSFVATQDPFVPYYTLANLNEGWIHKLITVGTPHLGSPLADYLIENRCNELGDIVLDGDLIVAPVTFEKVLAAFNRPVGPGVFGLHTSSIAIERLGATPVPTHAVTGVAPVDSAVEFGLNTLIVLSRGPLTNIDNLLDPAGLHDTIVPRDSQLGGLLAASSTITNVVHTGETKSPDVFDQVESLLLADVSSPFFSTVPAFVGPGNPDFSCPPGPSAGSGTSSTATITLTPVSGTSVAPGAEVTVDFAISGGVPVEGALLLGGDEVQSALGAGPFNFTFDTPTDQAGALEVVALAFGDGGEQYLAGTTLQVAPSSAVATISSTTPEVSFPVPGRQFQLGVDATLTDGSAIDVTPSSAGTAYSTQSGGSAVISVDDEGLILGVAAGSDAVLISNATASVSVPVTVPEPHGLVMLGPGALVLTCLSRRRRVVQGGPSPPERRSLRGVGAT
ncbi:MAG: alpha/beta fold hydrolase [Myxococcota bacterium]